MGVVERVDKVYLWLQGLSEYCQPPLLDVAQYIDLFRQILEVRRTVFHPVPILINHRDSLFCMNNELLG